ncbi:MAG TPA: HNH endonuclease signature motif containing protein [Polyangiaceae bacterium]|nr:HNH endonuclease signature motif containing protein [Polyangiaceae bacterium]
MREVGQVRGLEDDELLAALLGLVRQDHELLADMLAHLAELDQRRLYLDLGFPSLHAYCTSALGMCESSAGRRITAARVCRKFPDVLQRVAKGELHLSAVCSMSQHLDWNNAPELIELCANKSRRKVDEILAARFPRADVREKVRLDPLSVDRYGLHFTIDSEALQELERVRALARHRLPDGNLAELFKLAMKTLRAELEKQRFAVGKKRRVRKESGTPAVGEGEAEQARSKSESSSEVAEQPPPAAVKRASVARPSPEVAHEVYVRDQGQCTFVAQDGRRCGTREFLQFDHIDPRALGGEPTAENLRLRCRPHNLLYARDVYGDEHMAAAIARARAKTRKGKAA